MAVRVVLLVLAGLLGGGLGGMGMGGGTLLIPLLAMCGVPQHTAQAINLVTFIPMAVVALIVHIKNKAVDFKGVWLIILPACAVSVGFAFLSSMVKSRVMTILFGIFLALLGITQLIIETIKLVKKHKEAKKTK